MFQNVLKGKNESKPQGSIECNDLKDPLVSIVTEKTKFKVFQISV
jgi:hypothetical protein